MPALNLLVLRCRDIAITRGLYDALGLEFERHKHGDGPEHLASESDDFVFELYPATDGRADTAALGFRVDDLDAVRQQLLAAGFAPSEVRNESWGRVCVVRDADNRRIELKQR